MTLTYKGSIFYKMQAGMGDVVFAPMYEVLRRRGVKFRFFHRLDNIRLSRDKTYVAALELGQQATVKFGLPSRSPVRTLNSQPCHGHVTTGPVRWPSPIGPPA